MGPKSDQTQECAVLVKSQLGGGARRWTEANLAWAAPAKAARPTAEAAAECRTRRYKGGARQATAYGKVQLCCKEESRYG